jgi:hypothetical protein
VIHPYHRLREISVQGAPEQSLASSVLRRLQALRVQYDPPGIDSYVAANRFTAVVEHVVPPGADPPATARVSPGELSATP